MYPPRVNLEREHWALTAEHETFTDDFAPQTLDVVAFAEDNSYGIIIEDCDYNAKQFVH